MLSIGHHVKLLSACVAFFFRIMKGFIKLNRSDEAMNLQHNMCANHLFYIIALRAARKENKVLGLKPGDALLGDWQNYGMSRQQYRTALKNLTDWSYIKVRVTNKGTIATICNTDVYDLNFDEPNHPITIKQPSSNHPITIKQPSDNHQVTTNKNNKNIKNVRNKESKKGNISFVFEKIKNSHLLTLEQYEKEAASIVKNYYQNLGFTYEDFMIVMPKEIIMLARTEHGRFEKSFYTLQKAFFTYIYKKNITNIQSLQIHLKEIQRVKHLKTTPDIPDKITEAVRLATQKNYTKIYLDNIK